MSIACLRNNCITFLIGQRLLFACKMDTEIQWGLWNKFRQIRHCICHSVLIIHRLTLLLSHLWDWLLTHKRTRLSQAQEEYRLPKSLCRLRPCGFFYTNYYVIEASVLSSRAFISAAICGSIFFFRGIIVAGGNRITRSYVYATQQCHLRRAIAQILSRICAFKCWQLEGHVYDLRQWHIYYTQSAIVL